MFDLVLKLFPKVILSILVAINSIYFQENNVITYKIWKHSPMEKKTTMVKSVISMYGVKWLHYSK